MVRMLKANCLANNDLSGYLLISPESLLSFYDKNASFLFAQALSG